MHPNTLAFLNIAIGCAFAWWALRMRKVWASVTMPAYVRRFVTVCMVLIALAFIGGGIDELWYPRY